MKAAEIDSRRKICSKVRRTDVVPAPDDPVTEMMGCFTDTIHSGKLRSSGKQAASCEQRRNLPLWRVAQVIALDPFNLLTCSEYERHALVQKPRHAIQDALAAGRALAIGLFHQERDRVRLIDQPQPAV